MKALDLQPTHENLFKTFQNDVIGRNSEIFYFVQLLNSINGAFSIALNGKWGSGKTFFIKQTKMVLDYYNDFFITATQKNEFEKQIVKQKLHNFEHIREQQIKLLPHICVYYDAWLNDHDEDPILSLIYEISKSVSSAYEFEGERDYLNAATAIADSLTGINTSKALEALRKKSPTDPIQKSKDLQEKINDYFYSLLPEQGERLNIFIDELDRCNPCFAIRLLERIKHYFSNDKVTFIFAINPDQLQHTIKQYYGANFDAYKYLDRFFDFRFELLKPDYQRLYQSLNFIDNFCIMNLIASQTIKYFNFEMRETSRYLTMIQSATGKISISHNTEQGFLFCLNCFVPIVLALQIHNITQYYDFINGKFPGPFIDILSNEEIQNFIIPKTKEYTSSTNMQIVNPSVSNILKDIYDHIFLKLKNEKSSYGYQMIHSISFNNNSYDLIMRTAGMLSPYSSYTF